MSLAPPNDFCECPMDDAIAGFDILTVLGEIFVAFAGFTGIVAVLGQRSEGTWRPVDIIRFQALVEASLAGLLFAIAPFALFFFNYGEPTIWGLGSGVLAVYIVYSFVRVISAQKRLDAASDPDFVPGVRRVLLALAAPVLVVLFMNAFGIVFQHTFAAYFLGLLQLLVMCCAMFVLLLRFIRVTH